MSQIAQGMAILDKDVRSVPDLEERKAEFYTWCEFNEEFLRRAFSDDSYQRQFRATSSVFVMSLEYNFGRDLRDFKESVGRKIRSLESIAGRLDLIDEESHLVIVEPLAVRLLTQNAGRKVFIVHGRDEQLKSVVARFIERCQLEPIILHEQSDKGRTVIEKFEQESDVAFAVILLTDDDVGALRKQDLTLDDLAPRARQNVVFELGFFIGALGRRRVFALSKGSIELPSDYAGVTYTPYDESEGWKVKLVRELRAAGLDVDPSALL